jgi:hypothetical protein
MLVWRGFGIILPFLWGIGYFLMLQFTGPAPRDANGKEGFHALAAGLAAFLAAGVNFFLAHLMEKKGREASDDAFWFIPLKYWTIVLLVGGVIGVIVHFVK